MYRYLFICNENIGRSQMAEGFYNHKHGLNSSISAGIVDSTYKYNGRPRPDVILVMKELGIDMDKQRIKQLTKNMLDQADKIIVLCDKKTCPKIVLERTNVSYVKVGDPPDKDKTIEVLRIMRDKIGQIVEKL